MNSKSKEEAVADHTGCLLRLPASFRPMARLKKVIELNVCLIELEVGLILKPDLVKRCDYQKKTHSYFLVEQK